MSFDSGDVRPNDERTDAREQTIMLLYEGEQRSLAASVLLEERTVASEDLTRLLVGGIERRGDEIDARIVANARGWVLERMPALDRAILRLGIFELMERDDVPVAVVIDEAVELAKRFSTDDSGRFVNGVLAAVAKQVRLEQT